MTKKIIRLPKVKDKTGLSRSSIYEKMNQGLFPSSVSLGSRAVGWLENSIDDWIDSRTQIEEVKNVK